MFSFKQFLTEEKNTHIEHLEDDIINYGAIGGRNAVNFLKSVRDMLVGNSSGKVNVSVKWDGAPAVICGTNPENGKFFVGTKSVFNVTPKVNYTNSDIKKNHEGNLAAKLIVALKELKKLNIRGVVQGDLLFTPGEIKKATIRGVPHIAFTPNTITYAVPSDSDLAGRILRAKIGVIFHTTYTGGTLQTMKANFGVNISQFGNVSSVFYSDASYRDVSGNVLFTKAESDRFDAILRMAEGSLLKSTKLLNLFATQTSDLSLAFRLKTFFNTYVREGETLANTKAIVAKFEKYYSDVIDDIINSKKTRATKDKYAQIRDKGISDLKKYAVEIYFAVATYLSLITAKSMLVNKLDKVGQIGTFFQTDDGYQVTSPEGYVAVDRVGKAVKLVDRLTFSRRNFTAAKNWK
tara:strand:- start:293 stop:1510 length:1218 start_codon:yes stop_codon:yes gene_type:complete